MNARTEITLVAAAPIATWKVCGMAQKSRRSAKNTIATMFFEAKKEDGLIEKNDVVAHSDIIKKLVRDVANGGNEELIQEALIML